MVRTWKDDLKGIQYNFLPHSVNKYVRIHTLLNDIYQSKIDDTAFNDIFTDDTKTALKPNCASLILDAIWQVVTNRAAPMTESTHLTGLMAGCKTKLVMNFIVGTTKTFVPFTCGDTIGKAHIQDLLDHTMDNTTEDYATIDFHINVLYFINEFIPEDLGGMAFTPFSPPIAVAPVAPPAANPTGPTTTRTTGPSPLNTTNPYFNVSALPTDVQLRYKMNQAANSVMTSADMCSFIAQPAS